MSLEFYYIQHTDSLKYGDKGDTNHSLWYLSTQSTARQEWVGMESWTRWFQSYQLLSVPIHILTKKHAAKKLDEFYQMCCVNTTAVVSENKAVLEPQVSPAFAITYFCNHCNIRFENTSKYVDTLTLFSKNLNQRSLTPRWPLTPCLLRSHVWLYPRIIVSKSHDNNTSMYVDTVINFAKYHIHTTCRYILRTEWVIT